VGAAAGGAGRHCQGSGPWAGTEARMCGEQQTGTQCSGKAQAARRLASGSSEAGMCPLRAFRM